MEVPSDECFRRCVRDPYCGAIQVQTNFNPGCDLYVLGPADCRYQTQPDAAEFRGNTDLPVDRIDSAPGQACWALGEPDCQQLGAAGCALRKERALPEMENWVRRFLQQ